MYRQVSAQLERVDYRELYRAYSGYIRKSQVEPRVLFEILVLAYIQGVYTSRKIERLCRENVQFMLVLDGRPALDHCITKGPAAVFLSATGSAREPGAEGRLSGAFSAAGIGAL